MKLDFIVLKVHMNIRIFLPYDFTYDITIGINIKIEMKHLFCNFKDLQKCSNDKAAISEKLIF